MARVKNEKNQVFLGSFIHSIKLDELKYMHQTAVFVDKSGTIVAVERDDGHQKLVDTRQKLGWSQDDTELKKAAEGEFFFPGFIGQYSRHDCIEMGG